MLYRKISNDIMEWLHTGKKALLVSGTDRIGKTTIIQECLKSTHHSFIELNFKKQPELIELFEKATSTQDLLLRLSVVSKEPLIKGKTVIFFDEIQEFKDIMTRIKFLVDDGTYRFIMSGSLLGVELHNLRSAPVGYVEILDMFPLDFEEFLLANGIGENIIQKLKECFENRKPVDEFIHKKMLDILYLYLIVGGMPEAVVNYIETNNIQNVSQTHKNIIHLYEQDFTKYEDKYRLMLKEIYTTMASELNKQNKRFKLNSVKTGISYDRIKNDFLWLKDAGVALPVYNIEEPKQPLLLNTQRSLFKLFYSDVGLLTSLYSDIVKMKILNKDKDINNGALFENVIAQELAAHHVDLYYYNSKKFGELDFVCELDGEVVPIEVKSGKDYKKHSALENVLHEAIFDIHRAYILSNGNVEVKDKKVYLPIYMIMFIENIKLENPIYKLDLNGLH